MEYIDPSVQVVEEADPDTFRIGDLPLHSVVQYREEWWRVIGRGFNKDLGYELTELANGPYWMNRAFLPSSTPVMGNPEDYQA